VDFSRDRASRVEDKRVPNLLPGDAAPWFTAPTSSNPTFSFSTVAGRYIVLYFIPSSTDLAAGLAIEEIRKHRALFDDDKAALFFVTRDPADQSERRLVDQIPGIRCFYDVSGEVAAQFGLDTSNLAYQGRWYILDPMLRVLAMGEADQPQAMLAIVERLPIPEQHAGVPLFAPVLMAPRIFEPEFCKRLIAYYEQTGGTVSGFMRDVNGKTVAMHDRSHKRRKDCIIEDAHLRDQARARVQRRLIPEIEKAFQFKATRMERYLVACYEGADQGHFRRHRDNTTAGTAHRKFAVTLNLNSEQYEGGELMFPEFGRRTYKPPTGGAVVFSCSLLHEATPVTKGVRYVFVPFLYDEAGARVREANMDKVDDSLKGYRASASSAEPAQAQA
jgi:predicted 2-oxoglutarate/Fe(II)-dependent dioxygenase YbiX/peroxiredoxin